MSLKKTNIKTVTEDERFIQDFVFSVPVSHSYPSSDFGETVPGNYEWFDVGFDEGKFTLKHSCLPLALLLKIFYSKCVFH